MSHLFILAQTAASSPPGDPAGPLNIVIWIVIIAAMYFLVIAPQQHKEKEQQKLLKEMQKGDEVVTIGGVIGTIEKITDTQVTLRTGDKTLIDFQRVAIASRVADESPKKS
jgi:preprotein translocase subunit YajC